jgi:electron transport complex protein RnfC
MIKPCTFIADKTVQILETWRIWLTPPPFHGGLRLCGHKQHTANKAIMTSQLPDTLIYPLWQRGGYAKPHVTIGERVLKNQVIATADSALTLPIHAASSGIITAIENRLIPHPSGLADLCIVIKTDGKDESITGSPLKDWQSCSVTELISLINQAGIVGLGGAAFPTALKLASKQKINTLIINAVECEPYLSCDDSLIQHHAAEIIKTVLLLAKKLSISRCIIAIEDDMPTAQSCLVQALAENNAAMRTGSPLNNCPSSSGIELVSVPTLYPSGSEKQLIQLLTGQQVSAFGIPSEMGMICLNVATVFAIFQAVYQQQPLIERIITVTGDGVTSPQNMRVRIGTPIKDLITQCGGYSDKAKHLLMGGAMMGVALSDDEIPVVKATNCLLVGSDAAFNLQPVSISDELVINFVDYENLIPQTSVMPCIRCGECATVCPAQLLPQQLYWYSRAELLPEVERYQLSACIECGCCDMVCPSHIPLVQYFRAAKGKIALKNQQAESAALAKRRYEAQQQRKQKELEAQAERARKQKQALEEMKAKLAAKKKV